MRGYVGNTDFEWFSFLAAHPELEEINFWQPSGGRNFRAISAGEPFFLKLKKPHYAIAGFAVFVRHLSSVPTMLAWDAFGVANGAPDFVAMKQSIAPYVQKTGGDADTHRIGCIILSNLVFFKKEEWIDQPNDWQGSIVQGKTYDLSTGEGKRIHDQCQARLTARAASTMKPGMLVLNEEVERYGAPQLVRPRLGQGGFRLAVTDAYGGACAVTDEHSLPVLEAAHIQPFASGGSHEVENGLLLRTDIHRLFDKGYVTITKDYKFQVSRLLRERYKNGRTYYSLQDRAVRVPASARDLPSQELLSWHNNNVFLG